MTIARRDPGPPLPIVVLPDDVSIETAFLPDEPLPRARGEEAARRRLEEEARRRQLEEEARRRQLEEEARRRLEEEVRREVEDELAREERARAIGLAVSRAYILTACVAVILLAVLLGIGWEYYTLALGERPFHHFHELLRPSGALGLSFAVLGTVLMLGSAAYVIRKKLASWRWPGPLRAWMGVHIFTGVLGPALILFHAAFVPYSAVGLLAFLAMVVVVATGVLGRYIYAHTPRSLEGRELELEVIRGRLLVYRGKLLRLGVAPELLEIGVGPGPGAERSPWILKALVTVFTGDRQSRVELARLEETVRSRGELREQAREILPLLRRLFRERHWLVRYRELRKVMGAWRFFHRWLAVVMLIALFYHVAMALDFGGLWPGRGSD
jgi:hypothetical protein